MIIFKLTTKMLLGYNVVSRKAKYGYGGGKMDVQQDLEENKEQSEKLFKAYKDVIFAATQGKINLLNYRDSISIASEGILCMNFLLEQPEHVTLARQRIIDMLTQKKNLLHRLDKIELCVSEAATNVIKHAKHGEIQVRALGDMIRIIVWDRGPGMDYDRLPYMLLLKGYSTKNSLGLGFSLISKYADRVQLSTSKFGTFLFIEFNVENKINDISISSSY